MSYLVAHLRRVPTLPGVNLVARHNNRVGAYTEDGQVQEDYPHYLAHPERRGLNEYHCDSAEVIAAREARIEAAGVRRKPQKNAARAVEITISASHDWFEGKSEREQKAYFAAARAALGQRYGAEQIIGWSTHFDEETPHMHVVLVPLVHTEAKGWRYSASEFCGGRKELFAFHDELAQALEPFGVERGERGKGAEHTDLPGWKRELERREKAVARREKEQDRRDQALDERERILKESELMWAKRGEEICRREAIVMQDRAALDKYRQDLNGYRDSLQSWELAITKKAAGKGKGRDAGEEMGR
jgi:hypothetical protein